MTSEPTDLRERIMAAIRLTPFQRGRVSREVGQVAQSLARREMLADNVLAIVREVQAEAAEAAMQRVRALHEHRTPEPPYVEYCEHCGADWPRATIRALGTE